MTTSTFILFLLLFSYSSPSVHPISWASKESSFHFVLFDDGHGSGDGANENRTENLIPFNGGRHRSVEGTKSPQNGRMNERSSGRIGRTSGWVGEWTNGSDSREVVPEGHRRVMGQWFKIIIVRTHATKYPPTQHLPWITSWQRVNWMGLPTIFWLERCCPE